MAMTKIAAGAISTFGFTRLRKFLILSQTLEDGEGLGLGGPGLGLGGPGLGLGGPGLGLGGPGLASHLKSWAILPTLPPFATLITAEHLGGSGHFSVSLSGYKLV